MGYALGRTRNGGKVLRWSTYLTRMKDVEHEGATSMEGERCRLPPMHDGVDGGFVIAPAKEEWAQEIMDSWGSVSETEALSRALKPSTHSSSTSLGNDGVVPSDSRISPYLRFGILSPRRAFREGKVRKRDLLWREWSRVCYFNVLNPLINGSPVVPQMDGCCAIQPSDDDEMSTKFKSWCVGNTGSPIVDAGMKQLWLEGWMPRSVRLLCAACLVEGLGLDWRSGRDWFSYTLIDYDPAINEMMWQNAGLCGVDPFYRGAKWEVVKEEDAEYVETYKNRELLLPGHLREYAKQVPDPMWVERAKERRNVLKRRGVYSAARRIVNSGIRVAWPGVNINEDLQDGDVWGVGRTRLEDLDLEINKWMRGEEDE